MKNQIFKILGCLLIILTFSCSTEDGKDGEQGPAGTANVMYSNWMNQNWNDYDQPTSKSMSIEESNLTLDFRDNGGIVLGYFKVNGSSTYEFPLQDYNNNNVREFKSESYPTNGYVRYTIKSTDGTTLTNVEVNGSTSDYNPQYRYILIPGGVNISGKSSTDYKKMSYKEICELFNIPE